MVDVTYSMGMLTLGEAEIGPLELTAEDDTGALELGAAETETETETDTDTEAGTLELGTAETETEADTEAGTLELGTTELGAAELGTTEDSVLDSS